MACSHRGWRALASPAFLEELPDAIADAVHFLDRDVRPDGEAEQLVRERLGHGELPLLPALRGERGLEVDGLRVSNDGVDVALAQAGEERVALARAHLK